MTAEQDSWRKLLESVDLSGLADGAGEWQIEKNILNSDGQPEKRYSLRKGLVGFEMGTDQEMAALVWDARLPKYLKPGNGLDSYMDFIYWMLIRLPTRLYPERRTAWHYRQAYQEHTSVNLLFTNGEERGYKFSNEVADKRLAIDFVTRGDEIQSVLVTGTESPLLGDFKYMLKVDRFGPDEGQMALVIPTKPENLIAWNPATLEWILGTHSQNKRLGDLTQEAILLSRLVYKEAEEAIRQKVQPQE